jgi:predicted GNAT family acetyltransferase
MAYFAHKVPAHLAEILDRPVWTSLTSSHVGFAHGCDGARRLLVAAGPFAAAKDDRPENVEALEQLILARGGEATLMQATEPHTLPTLRKAMTVSAVQMIASSQIQPRICQEAVRLTSADATEMQTLAALAKPGPFEALTHLLGRFWGIRRGNRLIAMAGERLRQPGYTEISAVSVHPDFRGQALGSELVRHAAAHIVIRGDLPYLHVLTNNTSAMRIYESVGFRVRTDMTVTWISATTDTAKIGDKTSAKTFSLEET